MSVELIIGLSSVGGVLIGGVLTFFAARSKNTSEASQGDHRLELEERRDTVADRDNLIAILQGSVDRMETEMGRYRSELDEVKTQVREVTTHNNVLVTFVYKMLAVFRQYDLEHEIPDPRPDGIEF